MAVSIEHESLVELFRRRPLLAADLLERSAGHPTHATNAELLSTDLSELRPIELRADAVVLLNGHQARRTAVIVEVQRRPDASKRWSWPAYVPQLRARLRADVLLLVLTLDNRTARWAAQPISTGHPGYALAPVVLGPSQIPVIVDPDEARADPELAILSLFAHVRGASAEPVARAATQGALDLDAERRELYLDLITWSLQRGAPHLLELVMANAIPFKSTIARQFYARGQKEGRQEGRQEGQLELVRQMLTHRFGALPAWAEERLAEAGRAEITRWASRLLDAPSLEAVLGPPPRH